MVENSVAVGDSGAADATEPHPSPRRRRWSPRRFVASRRHPRLWWSATALALVVVALAGAVFGYAAYRNGQIKRVAVQHLAVTGRTENLLLIGSTSRCVLDNKQTGAFGSCAAGVTGVNSDVVIVVHLDAARHVVSLLSIPRDTFIPNARPGEANRIDSALAYGPSQLVQAVEQDFGIAINHYVELNFDTFQNVVKVLGGVYMYFPYPLKDAQSGLAIAQRGCAHLGPFQTLALVRARHLYYERGGVWHYDGSGDLGRIARVHEFLRVLAGSVAARGLSNPFTDNALIGAIAPQLEVDQGFSLGHMLNLALTFRHVDAAKVPQRTLPVIVDSSFDYSYKGYNYGAVVFPSEPGLTQSVASFLGAALPGAKVTPARVRVYVEGATASPANTAATAVSLRALGYHVLGTSEVPPVGPISEAQVLYAPGHLAQGERVLSSLQGAVALGQSNDTHGADVVVVTGSNFLVDHPTVPHALKVATTLTNPVQLLSASVSPITGPLEPPTPAVGKLPFWDPHACAPSKR